MTKFGQQLGKFRRVCNDPDRLGRRLSQERLGQLMGLELGDQGFTGAAVSDWERGKSKVHADNRKVLICLVKVLHKCGGLRTPGEADEFLESGNYRRLNPDETKIVFPESSLDMISPETVSLPEKLGSRQGITENFFSEASREFQEIVMKAKKEGPAPFWPRMLAALMKKASERWSISITSFFWIAVWFLAWWLVAPSLRWPFEDRDSAYSAIVMYVGGTLVIPLLIGLLVNTKDSEYWKQQGLADSALVRLYTYQGAGIGFNLGYFFVFPLVLLRYYLGLESSIWLELMAVILGLVLGNMSARVVPHNLWLAYGRLRFVDGAIFFVVALLGPLWGLFFLEFYSVLLAPAWGIAVILSAAILTLLISTRRFSSKAGYREKHLK